MARRPRRRQSAQAVIEMALVIPILLALVFNFLGVMVEVEGQNRAQAAVSYAADASVTGPLANAHLSCVYASQAFWSTVYNDDAYATSAGFSGCPGNPPPNPPVPAVPAYTSAPSGSPPASTVMTVVPQTLTCTNTDTQPGFNGVTINYLDGGGYPIPAGDPPPIVRCTATVAFDFKQSPLGAFIFWKPTFTVSAGAAPTAVRQCDPTVQQCVQ